MKVAISITKVLEVKGRIAISLEELRHRVEDLDENDEEYIDWYDIEPEQEIWSYSIVE